MLDHAVLTFTFDEYITVKRIVLDGDARGTLDFVSSIAKRLDQAVTRQASMKNAIDA